MKKYYKINEKITLRHPDSIILSQYVDEEDFNEYKKYYNKSVFKTGVIYSIDYPVYEVKIDCNTSEMFSANLFFFEIDNNNTKINIKFKIK